MSNVSSNKRSSILVDYRTNVRSVKTLRSMGYNVFFTRQLDSVYSSINGHADIQICKAGSKYICEPALYEYYKEIITADNLLCGQTHLKSNYPYDIAYNVCCIGNHAFHNFKYTDKVIYDYLQNNDYCFINIAQGYSKCNICVIADNAFITSDERIYKKAVLNKMDVLKINCGSIKLKDFDYGFIGGATGLIEKNILAVNGSLKEHPDYQNIKSFCNNYNVDLLSLNSDIAEDIGSIVKIESNSVK